MQWKIDNSHSLVEFSVKHLMVSTVKGRFSEVSGRVDLDEANTGQDYVEATINTASISTGDEKRDGHLRSPEFFDAEQFPTITFKSTKVEKLSDDEYRVAGDLTMHGVTKEVVLKVDYSGQIKGPWGDTRAGFSATTSINRKDFGLNWNVTLEAGGVMVSEKVNIAIEAELVAEVPATA